VVGAVVEIREVAPAYSEEAFKTLEAVITKSDLFIEEIVKLSTAK
jgi:hypothetical protein